MLSEPAAVPRRGLRAATLLAVALLLALADAVRAARDTAGVPRDEVAVAFVDPAAWRCVGSGGCVDCANVTGTATRVRFLGAPAPSEMAVRPGATLHICPQ